MRASLRQWPAIAAVVVAAALPTVARADAATDLVGLINDYRRAPPACAGKRLPMAAPLAPSDLLARVAPADPSQLGAALRAAG